MNSEDVFQLFVNSFSTAIDPHTQYFSPKDAEDFRINMSKNLEGIGATLQTDGDYTVVRQVVKGSPADKSDEVNPGDRIVAVAKGEDGVFEDIVRWRRSEEHRSEYQPLMRISSAVFSLTKKSLI